MECRGQRGDGEQQCRDGERAARTRLRQRARPPVADRGQCGKPMAGQECHTRRSARIEAKRVAEDPRPEDEIRGRDREPGERGDESARAAAHEAFVVGPLDPGEGDDQRGPDRRRLLAHERERRRREARDAVTVKPLVARHEHAGGDQHPEERHAVETGRDPCDGLGGRREPRERQSRDDGRGSRPACRRPRQLPREQCDQRSIGRVQQQVGETPGRRVRAAQQHVGSERRHRQRPVLVGRRADARNEGLRHPRGDFAEVGADEHLEQAVVVGQESARQHRQIDDERPQRGDAPASAPAAAAGGGSPGGRPAVPIAAGRWRAWGEGDHRCAELSRRRQEGFGTAVQGSSLRSSAWKTADRIP